MQGKKSLTLTDECEEVIEVHGSTPTLSALYHSGAPHRKDNADWLISDSRADVTTTPQARKELFKISPTSKYFEEIKRSMLT